MLAAAVWVEADVMAVVVWVAEPGMEAAAVEGLAQRNLVSSLQENRSD